MAETIFKYNPSFLSDQELLESFVVRHGVLDLILEVLRDNVSGNNQHLLVIGPRGSGKTMLLRRVAVAVKQAPELDARWFLLPFGEESYEVTSAGEFWLEAVLHLGVQTGDPQWARAYDELLLEQDEQRLTQRCLARLLDFADQCGKRLLLVVENLNTILGEQLGDDDAWSLRGTLMHEPRLMLLGSATSRFDAVCKPDKAMFELFRVLELPRLSVPECRQVWNRVAGREITDDQARAVQILTGGNPRLLTILALFGANRSFRSLLEDLTLLVDEHTDYFKSNFENLPPAERKVFACLASLWEASLAGDVARAARMGTSTVSALLKRLEGRGAVQAVTQKGRKKRYQLAERLYNVYYLMRRGQDGGRVRAVVRFMVQFYGQERLHEALVDIAREACGLEYGRRQEHYQAIQVLCALPEVRTRLERLWGALPQEFLQLPDMPDDLKHIFASGGAHPSSELATLRKAALAAGKEERWEEAETLFRRIVAREPEYAWAWVFLGVVLVHMIDQSEEGATCLRKAIALDPEDALAWGVLGVVLADKLDQPEEGAACLRKAVELDPKIAWAWASLGEVLAYGLDEPEEGAACLRKAVELNPKYAEAWALLGYVLILDLDERAEGLECLGKAVALDPSSVFSLYLFEKIRSGKVSVYILESILENTGRPDNLLNSMACALMDAEDYEHLEDIGKWAREAVERSDGAADAHGTLARALALRGTIPEALEHVAVLLRHSEIVGKDIQVPTDILATAAALGHGQKALDLLLASPSLGVLEPLAAGLKLYLGLELHAPHEVKEIGEDIVKRIEYWKEWHASFRSRKAVTGSESAGQTRIKTLHE